MHLWRSPWILLQNIVRVPLRHTAPLLTVVSVRPMCRSTSGPGLFDEMGENDERCNRSRPFGYVFAWYRTSTCNTAQTRHSHDKPAHERILRLPRRESRQHMPSEKSEERLTQEAVGIVSAASETASLVLNTTMFHILNNQTLVIRLKDELGNARTDKGRPLTWCDLEALPLMVSGSEDPVNRKIAC